MRNAYQSSCSQIGSRELYVKLDSRELDFLNDRLVVLKLIQNFVIDIAAVRFISFDLVDDQFTPLP